MLDALYEFFRGAIGFSLVLVGTSFFLEPRKIRLRYAFGALFLSIGALFTLSALDPVIRLPLDLSNFFVAAAILILSSALYEIAVYLFADQDGGRRRHLVHGIGMLWTSALYALPFLDYSLGFAPVTRSVEDGHALAPFHAFHAVAVYAWPIGISVYVGIRARWNPLSISASSIETRRLELYALVIAAVLGAILAAGLVGSTALYRVGHTILEFLVVVLYLFIVAKPDLFATIRDEVREERARSLRLSDGEASIIAERLAALADDGRTMFDPDLDIAKLAKRLRLPAYRLSNYFNTRHGSSFPSWLNGIRVERARKLLLAEDRSILQIAEDAGFGSKAAFNVQFKRIVGMNPSEYRRANAVPGTRIEPT